MRVSTVLLIAALLSAQLYAQTLDGVFAFTWTAGFCLYQKQNKRENCDAGKVALWDDQSFTIHGLWPSRAAGTTYGAFNLHLFEKNLKLIDDMNNYWPAKIKASTTTTFLWQHEWETHGQDYAGVLYSLRPADFSGTVQERNDKLQVAFFEDVITFYKKINVKKLSAGSYSKANLAKVLGIAEGDFVLQCSSANIVRELQVCFESVKAGNNPKTCTKSTTSCSNTGTYVLPDWRNKGQSRVTNYPALPSLSSE